MLYGVPHSVRKDIVIPLQARFFLTEDGQGTFSALSEMKIDPVLTQTFLAKDVSSRSVLNAALPIHEVNHPVLNREDFDDIFFPIFLAFIMLFFFFS